MVQRLGRRAPAIVVGAVLAVVIACSTAGRATGPGGQASTISVSPESSAVSIGSTTTLKAAAHDASGNAAAAMTFYWSSSDTTIATVSQNGVVSARQVGAAQIAASAEGVSGVATVSVVGQPVATVVVSPSSATLRTNTTLQLSDTVKTASGAPMTGQVVTWTSSNTSVATVDAAGLIVAHAAGTAHITATANGVSGTATITVTTVPIALIAVTPRRPTVIVGQTAQLTATAEDSVGDPLGGSAITWRSLSPSIAAVSASGLVSGESKGTAIVQATAEGVIGADTVTVTKAPVSAVILSPSTSSLVIGQSEQLAATVTDATGAPISGAAVTFSSNNPAVATVNAATGVVTGIGPGITTITGSSQGKTGQAAVAVFQVPIGSVSVEPGDTTITLTGRATLRAVVIDSLGRRVASPNVTWSSTPAGRVSQTGVVTPQASDAGSGIAVVASSGGKAGAATVTVSAPPPAGVASVSVAPANTTITTTQTAQMQATVTDVNGHVIPAATVTWSSTPAGRVSPSGLVTPQPGDAGSAITIVASSGGKSGTATVNVTAPPPAAIASVSIAPANSTITTTQTAQLGVTVTDVNGHVVSSPTVTWSSTPTGRVSPSGLVTPQPGDTGSTIAVVASSGGQSGVATVNVASPAPSSTSVVVDPNDTTITTAQTAQLRVTVTNGGGNAAKSPHVDWSSTPAGRVSPSGLVTPQPVDAGTAITVVATSRGTSGTATVSVSPSAGPPPPPPPPVAPMASAGSQH